MPGGKETGVRPGEGGELSSPWGRLWLLYMLFSAATQVTDGVAHALVLARAGVAMLPPLFAAKALIGLIAAVAYVPLAAALGTKRTLRGLTIASALAIALGYGLVYLEHDLAYGAIYVLGETAQTVFKIHFGVVLLACLPAEEALARLPLVHSGARAGAVIGGMALLLAGPLGTAQLLLGAMTCCLAAAALVGGLAIPTRDPADAPAGGFWPSLTQGCRETLSSSLLRSIVAATALLVIARHGLRYLYSATLATSFGEAELAASFGVFVAAASVVTGLLQAFITPKLLSGAGLTATNLAYALLVAPTFACGWLLPPLWGAALARLVESELKMAVKTPVSNLLYGGLPPKQRSAARALVLGAVVPAATFLASGALLATPTSTTRWGLAAGGLLVAATLAQNRAYRRALHGRAEEAAGRRAQDALSPGDS